MDRVGCGMDLGGHFSITRRAILELKREVGSNVIIQDFDFGDYISDPYEIYGNVGAGQELVAPSPKPGRELSPYLHAADQLVLAGTLEKIPWYVAPHARLMRRRPELIWNVVENPAEGSICQDIEDRLDGDHERDTVAAQRAHFMRAMGSTVPEAYAHAVTWIMQNLGSAVQATVSRIEQMIAPVLGMDYIKALDSPWELWGKRFTSGSPSAYLGRAVHALQDSFAEWHVIREPGTEDSPGDIVDIWCYREQSKSVHAEVDLRWKVEPTSGRSGLSLVGHQAKNATRAMILLYSQMVRERQCEAMHSSAWSVFQMKWLKLGKIVPEFELPVPGLLSVVLGSDESS